MVDLKILEEMGSTKARLREVLTAVAEDEPPKKGEGRAEASKRIERNKNRKRDAEYRSKITSLVQARSLAGIDFSLRNHRAYAAVDLAWDSTILNKVNIPLLLYAQGKMDVQRAIKSLESCPNGSSYIVKGDPKKKEQDRINLPKFIEAEINLIRSMTQRRWAAQKVKFGNLYPHYNYEARGTGLVSKLRADVMSQRADIMTDQFGVREHDAQVMLDGLLYGHSVDFIRSSWEVYKQYRTGPNGTEDYIEKEGIGWINPHPSRVFWDLGHPIISINSDSGCEYVGFWDIARYGEIENNPDYFNRDQIGFGENMWGGAGFYSRYIDYFNQYNYVINPPPVESAASTPGLSIDLAGRNDSKSFVGTYNSTMRDSAMFLTNYFHKLVPKDWGLGDYPYPVWVRFVFASDSVPIFAEFLPSTPAAVLSINESHSRAVNASFAMDLMQWQQQVSNLLSHLMCLLQIESFKAIGINKDALEASEVAEIKKHLKSENWYADPLVFGYSLSKKLEQLGAQAKDAVKEVITVSEARQGQSINTIFDAMTKLIALAEKMQQMSAAESGQSEPREISATQTTVIANTTQTVYAAISDSIDAFREAKKRIIYESTVVCSVGQVNCPVLGRYTLETVKKAGFDVIPSEDEDIVYNAKRRTVIGSPVKLVGNYIFSSRDGSERPANTQAANTMTQLIGYTLAVPEIVKKIGREKLYSMFNEVFRLSGAGFDLNLEVREGEDDSLGENEVAALRQSLEQFGGMIQQLANQVMGNSQKIATQEQVNTEQQQAIDLQAQLAEKVRDLYTQISEIAAMNNKVETPDIPYKDAPPVIQAQMERKAGYTPATTAQRIVKGKKTDSPETKTT